MDSSKTYEMRYDADGKPVYLATCVVCGGQVERAEEPPSAFVCERCKPPVMEPGTWGFGYGHRRHLVDPETVSYNARRQTLRAKAMCSHDGNPVELDKFDHEAQGKDFWIGAAEKVRERVRKQQPCKKCLKKLPSSP